MSDFMCFFCEEKITDSYIEINKYHYYICESCMSDVTKAVQKGVQSDADFCANCNHPLVDGVCTPCFAPKLQGT